MNTLSRQEMYNAVVDGVAKGIFDIATNASQTPTHDFNESIVRGVTESIGSAFSLRDIFAAFIAGGDAAAGDGWEIGNGSNEARVARLLSRRAQTYFRIADAMVEARDE